MTMICHGCYIVGFIIKKLKALGWEAPVVAA